LNKLVEKLQDKNSPILFKYEDLNNIKISEKEKRLYLKEAIEENIVENVYNDIYIFSKKYRKIPYSRCVLAQLIDPTSYVSTMYVLSEENWIIDGVYSLTSISCEENKDIEIFDKGLIRYKKIYDNFNNAGIYTVNEEYGSYKIAKPLRALCDYLYSRGDKLYEIEAIEEVIRVYSYVFKKEIKRKDIKELKGKMNIDEIEMFLNYLEKELFL
jgi:hypothetical protein